MGCLFLKEQTLYWDISMIQEIALEPVHGPFLLWENMSLGYFLKNIFFIMWNICSQAKITLFQ